MALSRLFRSVSYLTRPLNPFTQGIKRSYLPDPFHSHRQPEGFFKEVNKAEVHQDFATIKQSLIEKIKQAHSVMKNSELNADIQFSATELLGGLHKCRSRNSLEKLINGNSSKNITFKSILEEYVVDGQFSKGRISLYDIKSRIALQKANETIRYNLD